MRKVSSASVFLVGILIITVLALVYFTRPPKTLSVHMPNGQKINAEIADTNAAKTKGLSERESLTPNSGMLFVYNKSGEYCFWMKDMHFNLDIIWLDESKEVVYLAQDISPDSYPQSFCSDLSANYVLEIAGGQAARLGLGVGSVISFK